MGDRNGPGWGFWLPLAIIAAAAVGVVIWWLG